ncbi:M23 family metallopeptidase [uncultured Microbacterium sp.]|jgi:murein DD-endopeptidase MepM/ murein hydrolase activator NlpD|uniref:M23 family metallopeptidase n=1 Tax=uncultured Microbacterium sp. TaxID=191216 RepID=UPI0026395BD6|nr:M23 family metallopeptidase [uncultured Microbacterium sp.]
MPAPIALAAAKSPRTGRVLRAVLVLAGVLAVGFGAAVLVLLPAFFGARASAGTAPEAGIPADLPGMVYPVDGDWGFPVAGEYTVTSNFGYRAHVAPHDHWGIDLAQGCGAPIVAAASGTVTFAGFAAGGWGNRVKIAHSPSVTTAYAHMETGSITVSEGDVVEAGQRIGSEGNTGVGTGCHLHFEVYQDGTRINPQPFMAQYGVTF